MAATMKVFQHETRLRTAGGLTVTDITEDVQNAVRESGVSEGWVAAYLERYAAVVGSIVGLFEPGVVVSHNVISGRFARLSPAHAGPRDPRRLAKRFGRAERSSSRVAGRDEPLRGGPVIDS